MPVTQLIAKSLPLDSLLAKRLASTVETRSRAVGGCAVLIVRRLHKPVGPEAIDVMGRLVELAMIDAQETVQNLRRLQTQLDEGRSSGP